MGRQVLVSRGKAWQARYGRERQVQAGHGLAGRSWFDVSGLGEVRPGVSRQSRLVRVWLGDAWCGAAWQSRQVKSGRVLAWFGRRHDRHSAYHLQPPRSSGPHLRHHRIRRRNPRRRAVACQTATWRGETKPEGLRIQARPRMAIHRRSNSRHHQGTDSGTRDAAGNSSGPLVYTHQSQTIGQRMTQHNHLTPCPKCLGSGRGWLETDCTECNGAGTSTDPLLSRPPGGGRAPAPQLPPRGAGHQLPTK